MPKVEIEAPWESTGSGWQLIASLYANVVLRDDGHFWLEITGCETTTTKLSGAETWSEARDVATRWLERRAVTVRRGTRD